MLAKVFPNVYRLLLKNYSSTFDADFTKARLFLSFIFITIFISLSFFIIYQFTATNIPTELFLITPCVVALLSLLLRTKIPFGISANILIVFYWFALFAGIYFSGGIHSLVLPWLSLLPFMASVLTNYRTAIGWFSIVLITIIGFTMGSSLVPSIRYTSDPWRALFSGCGLAGMFFIFATLYHQTQSRFVKLLRDKNHILLEHQDEVLTQNEELKEQRDIIEIQQTQIKQVNDQLLDKLTEIARVNEVLEEQREVLVHLTKCRWIKEGELKAALKEVALLASRAMGITQVTVWRINDTHDRLQASISYSAITNSFSSGADFAIAGYQLYYEVLYDEKIIAVEDVLIHELTEQNAHDYFIPNNIKSCMDVPYYIGGELGGTISFENHEHKRMWTSQDKNFAKALADIVTLAIESAWRREYEKKISEQNEAIAQINKGLEDRVRKRTEELEKQNEKLSEYAFINSHVLRGPLSRMLGLIHLLEMSETKDEQLINYLKQSGAELDEVVKKINNSIALRGEVERRDFR
jgi:GAF domain